MRSEKQMSTCQESAGSQVTMNTILLSLSLILAVSSGFVVELGNSDSLLITVDDSPVLVELYYESLCPGCRAFISTMLYPTFDKLRHTGIVKFALYPYGNAQQSQNKDGSWNITCQHGGHECQGNLLEVCLMHHLNWDSDLYLPVISCMESADDPVESAEGCITQLSSASYDDVKHCADVSIETERYFSLSRETFTSTLI